MQRRRGKGALWEGLSVHTTRPRRKARRPAPAESVVQRVDPPPDRLPGGDPLVVLGVERIDPGADLGIGRLGVGVEVAGLPPDPGKERPRPGAESLAAFVPGKVFRRFRGRLLEVPDPGLQFAVRLIRKAVTSSAASPAVASAASCARLIPESIPVSRIKAS